MPTNTPPEEAANADYQPLLLDLAKYRQRLDAHDLSDAQKDQYINALWLLVVSFADLKIPPIDAIACGKPSAKSAAASDGPSAVVYSKPSKTVQNFGAAANAPTPPKAKREAL